MLLVVVVGCWMLDVVDVDVVDVDVDDIGCFCCWMLLVAGCWLLLVGVQRCLKAQTSTVGCSLASIR